MQFWREVVEGPLSSFDLEGNMPRFQRWWLSVLRWSCGVAPVYPERSSLEALQSRFPFRPQCNADCKFGNHFNKVKDCNSSLVFTFYCVMNFTQLSGPTLSNYQCLNRVNISINFCI